MAYKLETEFASGPDSIPDVIKIDPNPANIDPAKTSGRAHRRLLQNIVDTLYGLFARLTGNEIRGVDKKVRNLSRRDAIPALFLVAGDRCAVTYNADQATLDAQDPSLWPGPAEYFLLRDSTGPLDAFVDGDKTTTETVKCRWVRSDGSFTDKVDSYPDFVPEDQPYKAGDVFKAPIPYPGGAVKYLQQVKRNLPLPNSGGINPVPTGVEDDNYLPFAPITASVTPKARFVVLKQSDFLGLLQDEYLEPDTLYHLTQRVKNNVAQPDIFVWSLDNTDVNRENALSLTDDGQSRVFAPVSYDPFTDEATPRAGGAVDESNLVHKTGPETVGGAKTLTETLTISSPTGNVATVQAVFKNTTQNYYAGLTFYGGSTIGNDRTFQFGQYANGDAFFYQNGNSPIDFFTGGQQRLRIATNGNIGMGTSNPTEKLDVNGNVKATGFIGDGSQLTNLPAATVDESNIVHKDSNEEIAGAKTFIADIQAAQGARVLVGDQSDQHVAISGSVVSIGGGAGQAKTDIYGTGPVIDDGMGKRLTANGGGLLFYDSNANGGTSSQVQFADGGINMLGEFFRTQLDAAQGDDVVNLRTLAAYLAAHGGGGGGGLTPITYAELIAALADNSGAGSLSGGGYYLLTDFFTTHPIGDPNTQYDIYSAPVEPLVLFATAPNALSPIAYSPTHPTDIIYYSIDNTSNRWPWGQTGFIYRRIDTVKNNDLPLDFRTVKFRRWMRPQTQDEIDNFVDPYYIILTDNGQQFQDMYLFDPTAYANGVIYANSWTAFDANGDILSKLNSCMDSQSFIYGNTFVGTTFSNNTLLSSGVWGNTATKSTIDLNTLLPYNSTIGNNVLVSGSINTNEVGTSGHINENVLTGGIIAGNTFAGGSIVRNKLTGTSTANGGTYANSGQQTSSNTAFDSAVSFRAVSGLFVRGRRLDLKTSAFGEISFAQDWEFPVFDDVSTVTINPTGRVIGAKVGFYTAAGQPELAIPTTGEFVADAHTFTSGQRHQYQFAVRGDGLIHYTVAPY